ncbi:MAG: hypothetical protein ACRCX8_10235 [Sarcina sp.]
MKNIIVNILIVVVSYLVGNEVSSAIGQVVDFTPIATNVMEVFACLIITGIGIMLILENDSDVVELTSIGTSIFGLVGFCGFAMSAGSDMSMHDITVGSIGLAIWITLSFVGIIVYSNYCINKQYPKVPIVETVEIPLEIDLSHIKELEEEAAYIVERDNMDAIDKLIEKAIYDLDHASYYKESNIDYLNTSMDIRHQLDMDVLEIADIGTDAYYYGLNKRDEVFEYSRSLMN